MKENLNEFFNGYRYWKVWLALVAVITVFFIWEMIKEDRVVFLWIVLLLGGWSGVIAQYVKYRKSKAV